MLPPFSTSGITPLGISWSACSLFRGVSALLPTMVVFDRSEGVGVLLSAAAVMANLCDEGLVCSKQQPEHDETLY